MNIAMYDIIQNNLSEMWALKDCDLCVLLWANHEANIPYLFPSTFSSRKAFVMIVFGMTNI